MTDDRVNRLRRVMEATGENTKAKALDVAMESYLDLLDALERVGDHPNMTEELAEALSTPHVEVIYRTKHEVNAR